jgi:hypothetical protein
MRLRIVDQRDLPSVSLLLYSLDKLCFFFCKRVTKVNKKLKVGQSPVTQFKYKNLVTCFVSLCLQETKLQKSRFSLDICYAKYVITRHLNRAVTQDKFTLFLST